MGTLQHRQTYAQGAGDAAILTTDLHLVETGGGRRLVQVGPDSLTLRDADGRELHRVELPDSDGFDAPRSLTVTTRDGAPALLVQGRQDGQIDVVPLTASGAPGPLEVWQMEGPGGRAVLDMLPLGGDRFVTASRLEAGLSVWQRDGETLRPIAQHADAGLFGANDVQDLAAVTVAGRPHVLAVSAQGDALTLLAVSPGGVLTEVSRLDPRGGLTLDTPTLVEVVSLGGQPYAIVGAPGSGSLAVVRIGADGRLTPTDIVIDERDTRFDGLTALQTIEAGGRVWIAAAGADDGVTLLELLPTGRLRHEATLIHGQGDALGNPAAMVMAMRGGTLDLYVAGERAGPGGAFGVSFLQAMPDLDGRILRLADGGDTATGGAAADILIDGDGLDVLIGGPGADLFILGRDGEQDMIGDFEPGIDRLDLSGMGSFYTAASITIGARWNGALIRIGEEELRIRTADRTPLSRDDFVSADLRGLTHLDLTPPDPVSAALSGGSDDDILIGGDGDDRLQGGAGGDILRGGNGADRLVGATLDDGFDPLAAQVYRLYRATLDRDPDVGGLNRWVGELGDGTSTLRQAAAGFTGSPEFQRDYGGASDADFITLLYQNVLGRAPDAQGLAAWTGRLASGQMDRAQIVIGFSQSDEFIAATLADAARFGADSLDQSFADEVFRLYQAVLGRAPDAQGFEAWTGRLGDGLPFATVVAGFTQSPEFQRDYGDASQADFVTLLYQNVLGRDPEAAGLAAWTGRLAAGMSRETVVEGFVGSPEFIALSTPGAVDWMRGRGTGDTLDGGAGDDLLTGGDGADRFVFTQGADGHDIVTDLEPWDWLHFDGFGYDTPADARAHLAQVDDDVVFADLGVEITFLHTQIGDISDDMFVF